MPVRCRYDLANARDTYRFACGADGGNKRLLLRYIEVSQAAVWCYVLPCLLPAAELRL